MAEEKQDSDSGKKTSPSVSQELERELGNMSIIPPNDALLIIERQQKNEEGRIELAKQQIEVEKLRINSQGPRIERQSRKDQYDHRENLVKYILLGVIGTIIFGIAGFLVYRDYVEEAMLLILGTITHIIVGVGSYKWGQGSVQHSDSIPTEFID